MTARYTVHSNTEIRDGEPVGGFDVCDTDGRVVYRRCATLLDAHRRADALNAGEPEPEIVKRRPRVAVYPVGWEVWDEGIHFKTLDEINTYVTRLYTSAWFIRFFGSRLRPQVTKQRGQGGHGGNGYIRVGFNGGYARQGIVLHELAHEVLAETGEHHGPRFNRVWLELMRHEMGEAMERKLRELYVKHRVRMAGPTKPVSTVEYARERADRRARERLTPKLWRFEVVKDGAKDTATFEARTLGGAMTMAERKWGMDSLTSVRAWRGRASSVKQPARRAAMTGRGKG